MIFDFDKIQKVHEQEVDSGLHRKRDQLLFGINPLYVAGLAGVNKPSDQLLSDLNSMNVDGRVDGGIPLEVAT